MAAVCPEACKVFSALGLLHGCAVSGGRRTNKTRNGLLLFPPGMVFLCSGVAGFLHHVDVGFYVIHVGESNVWTVGTAKVGLGFRVDAVGYVNLMRGCWNILLPRVFDSSRS